MDEVIKLAIELVVLILSVIIGRYAIPWIKTNVDATKLTLIAEWALKFVKAAENILSGEKRGEEKREQVTAWLEEKANEIGIKLTEDQIRTLLEDAYTTMMQEANKVEVSKKEIENN